MMQVAMLARRPRRALRREVLPDGYPRAGLGRLFEEHEHHGDAAAYEAYVELGSAGLGAR